MTSFPFSLSSPLLEIEKEEEKEKEKRREGELKVEVKLEKYMEPLWKSKKTFLLTS